jgi:group I intron endonuclease
MVVYRITNLKNKKIYIGSTVNFEVRKAEHLGELRSNKHCNRWLQYDFRIFKEESFVFEILHDNFKTRDAMLLKEYELILKTKNNNYNIDTNCPVVSGRSERKSGARYARIIKVKEGLSKRDWTARGKVKGNHRIKVNHPTLDLIAERKRERDLNKAKMLL